MALKFTQTGQSGAGGSGGTYDHNLLVNRGLPDQHTIESITGLRTLLNKKYEKPFAGIPKSDLGFDVATLYDINLLRSTDLADVNATVQQILSEVTKARGGLIDLKAYIDTKVPYSEYTGGGGAGGGHLDSQIGYPIYEVHQPVDGQTTFRLSKTYRMGTRQLEVFYNGIRMEQDEDYIEVDENTVEFLWETTRDDRILFQVRAVINSGLSEEHIATEGQTVFKLSTPYGLNQNILKVFRNGVLQRKGRDYREIDNMTVEFMYPLKKDTDVTFFQAGATDPIAGTILESELGRMKINMAHNALSIQEASGFERTDYLDMYVDTFITTNSIDDEKSFPYRFENGTISVRPITESKVDEEGFLEGSFSNTDVHVIRDRIILSNQPGSSDLNSFQPMLARTNRSIKVIDAISLQNARRDTFFFYVLDKGTSRELWLDVFRIDGMNESWNLGSTSGYFFNLSVDESYEGNPHLVYHHQEAGKDIIKLLVINNETCAVMAYEVSDSTYPSILPDVSIGTDGTVHVSFLSKRINANRFNVDYRRIYADGTKSGVKEVTNYTMFDALNPRLVVGTDNLVRLVFESVEFDTVTKNIKIAVLDNGIKIHESYLTNSTTYENTMPDIDIDQNNECKIAWRSKRMGTSFGIDFCSFANNHIGWGTIPVTDGTANCGRPRISVDRDGVSHIVFDMMNTITYAYVRADGSLEQPVAIASETGKTYSEPDIFFSGNTLSVSFLGDVEGYEAIKPLTNYNSMGRYDLTIDTRTPNSEWHDVFIDIEKPTGTDVVIEYRLSDDGIGWSTWMNASGIQGKTGQFLHVRLSLSTTDYKMTPIIKEIRGTYTPTFIEVQSKPKLSNKSVDSIIAIMQAQGDIELQVSRDGGAVFVDAIPETVTNMLSKPFGQQVVIKAKIPRDASLMAWGALW